MMGTETIVTYGLILMDPHQYNTSLDQVCLQIVKIDRVCFLNNPV